MPEYYLGIDVGWSPRDASTGLCLIELDQYQLSWECRNSTSDNGERLLDLQSLIPRDAHLNGVGIDGPLAPGLAQVNHYRAADALLLRNLFRRRCRPGQTNSPNGQNLHNHAIQLANLVLQLANQGHLNVANAAHLDAVHQFRIVEAFPDAFLAFLLADADFQNLPNGAPGRARSDRYWEASVGNQSLQALTNLLAPGVGFGPLNTILNHDRRAAFICALSAMCVARNQYVAAGDPAHGDFILPPPAVWHRDAQQNAGWVRATLAQVLPLVQMNREGYPNHANARVVLNGHLWMP